MIFICSQFSRKYFPTFTTRFVVTPTTSKVESCSHISCVCCLLYRRLRHPHIVKFYGAVFRKIPRGLEAAFVAECPGVDLKKHLIDPEIVLRRIPWQRWMQSLGGPSRWSTDVDLQHVWRMCSRWPSVRKSFGREIFHFLIKSFVLHWFHTERKK